MIQQFHIRPKCGYWDTTQYPIGGKFCRTGIDGLLVNVASFDATVVHGKAYTIGTTLDGAKVAFDPQLSTYIGDIK